VREDAPVPDRPEPGVTASYVGLEPTALPRALATLHRALPVGAAVRLEVPDNPAPPHPSDGTGGHDRLADTLVGAGFDLDAITATDPGRRVVDATRARTLPDTVGPGMRVLVCGLNPSLYAADAGVGFARPGNRFWPAAIAAGLVDRARDPLHALEQHGVGMTDLVKRATPRADELHDEEYLRGLGRVGRLVAWLRPGILLVVGLAGWRAAVDRRTVAGLQSRPLGGRPVYVMPSTSGLNASSRLDDLTDHLRAALAAAGDRA
jgi:double-stranded uracil-DNA glycosylase